MKSNVNWIGLWTFVRRESQRFLRVPVQTLVTPWISAVLYIVIFGFVVGSKIDLIAGVRYIDFVLPGILMMNLIAASFSQTSSSIFFQRFARHIEEILVVPLSHFEMITGYVIGGIIRGIVVGLGVFLIAVFFSAASLEHFGIFLFYILSVSVVFSLVGIIVGLWAEQFEHLNVLNVFVILPLSFLGGVFNSITMLPEKIQPIMQFNPFFYFIDGIRYSMIGVSESNLLVGVVLIFVLIIGLGFLTGYLFNRGWRLRE
jgi:ABC-2 type transport system permease protein|tara:strand:- start:48977 stop:49750 length:774 start_codon:yes stop_codon:yes gene_type:complete